MSVFSFGKSKFWILLFFCIFCCTDSKRQPIEEIARRQLDSLLHTEDYLAIFWHGKNCKTCDRISSILETKISELEESGIKVVKINDKKTAKQYGMLSVPGLSFFKGGKGSNFEGDLTDEEALMDFLASPEALELEDQIEDVNAKQLEKLVGERPFVAVFFYNHQPESAAILQELENIDTQADKMNIAFVKINDLVLVDEFGLSELPALVYYRQSIPIPYEGDLSNENAVLEWLIQHRSTGDEEELIEEATAKSLDAMIGTIDKVVVLFYDPDYRKLEQLLEEMEKIDDDCSSRDIAFVKTAETEAIEAFGITKTPALVFFKNEIPNLYEGNILDETAALQWILSQSEEDSIEELTGTMLDKLIKQTRHLVVLFCKYIGYALIAVMHTCYLLRHYGTKNVNSQSDEIVQENNPMASVLVDGHYIPVEKVRGYAMED